MAIDGQQAFDAPQEAPTLTFRSAGGFSTIWLVYVQAVDLTEHCINTFIGPHSKRVVRDAEEQTARLDEHPVPLAYYLCGVTYPYSWADNAHLAFEYAAGHYWHGPALVPGLTVTLQDARPLDGWGPASIPDGAPHAGEFLYRTCRNWQFAWHLHRELGAEDRLNPGKYAHARRYGARSAQAKSAGGHEKRTRQ
jgi:hypothetical protein